MTTENGVMRMGELAGGLPLSQGQAASLRPGGVIVTSGATTGYDPGAELNRIFFTQLSVIGSTMGTRDELERLSMRMC